MIEIQVNRGANGGFAMLPYDTTPIPAWPHAGRESRETHPPESDFYIGVPNCSRLQWLQWLLPEVPQIVQALEPGNRLFETSKARMAQRSAIGTTFLPTGAPLYSLSGRKRRLSASCSRTWAVQPLMREMAKIGVKRSVGMPSE